MKRAVLDRQVGGLACPERRDAGLRRTSKTRAGRPLPHALAGASAGPDPNDTSAMPAHGHNFTVVLSFTVVIPSPARLIPRSGRRSAQPRDLGFPSHQPSFPAAENPDPSARPPSPPRPPWRTRRSVPPRRTQDDNSEGGAGSGENVAEDRLGGGLNRSCKAGRPGYTSGWVAGI